MSDDNFLKQNTGNFSDGQSMTDIIAYAYGDGGIRSLKSFDLIIERTFGVGENLEYMRNLLNINPSGWGVPTLPK